MNKFRHADKPKLTLMAIAPNHSSYYKSIIRLYSSIYDISIMCNPVVRKEIDEYPDIRWRMKTKWENMTIFILRSLPVLTGRRIVLLDEIYRFRRYIPLLMLKGKLKPEFWLTIHNVNNWFSPKKAPEFVHWRRRILRNAWLRQISGIVCVGSAMTEHVRSFGWPAKKVIHVPFGLPESKGEITINETQNDSIRVVIPGLVEMKRRDYFSFLEALERLPDNILGKIQVFLLGKTDPSLKRIFEIAQRINSRAQRENIKIWTAYLSSEDFSEVIRKSDLLLMNIKSQSTRPDGTIEIYGQSKETGMPYLAADHALPMLTPAWYNLPKAMESQCIKFDDYNHAVEILSKISTNKEELISLKKEAIKNRLYFTNFKRDLFVP